MIRHANEEDAIRVMELAHNFYQETPYALEIPYDPNTCAEIFFKALDQGLCSVAEENGEVVGFVLGLAFPSVMNRNYLMGCELAWWVEPAYRGSVGYRLLRHIEKSAQDLGVKGWSMVALEDHDPEKVEKIYLRTGYQKTERTYSRFY